MSQSQFEGAALVNSARRVRSIHWTESEQMTVRDNDPDVQLDTSIPLVSLSLVFTDDTDGYVSVPASSLTEPHDLIFAVAPAAMDEETAEDAWPFVSRLKESAGVQPVALSGNYWITQRGNRVFDQTAIISDIEKALDTDFRMGIDGRLYRRKARHYLPDGEDLLRHWTRKLLLASGEMPSTALVSKVLSHVTDMERLHRLPAMPDPDYIIVKQGAVNWKTGEPAFGSEKAGLVQLPVTYRPQQDCPQFRAWLASTLTDIPEEFIFEVMGYALLPTAPIHVAFILLGGGRNGKSVFLRVLRALVGDANVSATSLHDLAEVRFATSSLYGKLVNLHGDISARQLKQTGNVKELIGEDYIEAEFKGKDRFQFQSFATLFFSANAAPGTSDTSHAWYSRIIIVPFERTFEGAAADRTLAHRLTSSEELSGIFNHALAGARRVMTRGYFSLPDSVLRANQQYRAETDIIGSYVNERLLVDAEGAVSKQDLYADFSKWCKDEGFYAPTRTEFYGKMRELTGAGGAPIIETVRRFEGMRLAYRHE
jgi:putative DNA primase/helicase